MKILTKFAAAALLAISAAAPALAADPEALTLQERTAYVQQVHQNYHHANRAIARRAADAYSDAYAYVPTGSDTATHDFGISSQR